MNETFVEKDSRESKNSKHSHKSSSKRINILKLDKNYKWTLKLLKSHHEASFVYIHLFICAIQASLTYCIILYLFMYSNILAMQSFVLLQMKFFSLKDFTVYLLKGSKGKTQKIGRVRFKYFFNLSYNKVKNRHREKLAKLQIRWKFWLCLPSPSTIPRNSSLFWGGGQREGEFKWLISTTKSQICQI